MKKSILIGLYLIILVCTPVLSQNKITGRIEDIYKYGVAFANVLLLDSSDSLLTKGTVTDADGYYDLEGITSGKYIIESYMVGYAKSYSPVLMVGDNQELKVESIVLAEDVQELDEIVIKAEKPLYEMEMGKMIINVKSSITAAGNNAIDVLEKSPGVLVNRQNNSFSLGGKDGVIVLMNGKRSRMPMEAVYQMLEGLNASDIEKIEIMTVPPANYDADGDAGLINIVMKKGIDTGTNGSFTANLGYGSGPRAGGSVNLSHRAKKFSLYGNYSYNYTEQRQQLNFYRQTVNDTQEVISASEADREASRTSYNYQVGFDYYLSEKTIFSGLIGGYDNKFKMKSLTTSNFAYSISPDTLIDIVIRETNHWQQLMGNINIQHTISEGQVLNLDLDYLTYQNSNPTNYANQYYNEQGNPVKSTENRIFKDTPIKMWVGKLDYRVNLGSSIVFESGLKGTFSELVNDIILDDNIDGEWIINDNFSSDADLTENILAAYGSMKIKFDEKTSLNAGIRYEHTETYLSTVDEKGLVDRKYGEFFPTLFVSRKINDNNLIQFSYGRRITRPSFNEMAPFVLFIDPYTYTSGNANILPTLTNSAKGDYSYKSFIFSLQYSYDQNVIMRFQPIIDPETNIMVMNSDNIDQRETISANITLPFHVTDWWEMQNNIYGNWQRIITDFEGSDYKRNQNGFRLNSTQTFNLPNKYAIELAAFYMSPVINGYFNWLARGFVNLGIQKELTNNATIRFSCNDIFETSQFRWKSIDNGIFSYSGNIKFEKRIFTLTYNQKFGNNKVKGARKRSVGSAEELRRVTN
ncbi:TonB-dependent receptor domain-containing protein [Bacteroidota bacterium]